MEINILTDFCSRLREERKRLGLSQEEFAFLGGVQRNAQSTYERGERRPDSDYLAGIAENGVNVHYLLTGQKFNINDNDALKAILTLNYFSEGQRAVVFEMIKQLDLAIR